MAKNKPTKTTTIRSKWLLSEGLSPLNIKFPQKRRQGQSVIEFAVVSMIFVSMLFISYNAVMAFAFQQYVAHAVFMAARSYQAAHDNPATQENTARSALSNYGITTGRIMIGPIRAEILDIEVPDPTGVPTGSGKPTDSGAAIRVKFSMPLAALPLGQGDWDAVKRINLEAASFLGREPTSAECYSYFSDLMDLLVLPGAPNNHRSYMVGDFRANQNKSKVVFALTDNGC